MSVVPLHFLHFCAPFLLLSLLLWLNCADAQFLYVSAGFKCNYRWNSNHLMVEKSVSSSIILSVHTLGSVQDGSK